MGEINNTLDSARAKTKQWMYYFIVGIVSLITLVFLPMIGSTAGLAWAIPNTVVGWIVWVAIKLIVAALNVIIFHCFVQQGKLNIKDHPDFKEAKGILETITAREEIPMSPSQWTRKTYLTKGVTVFITTALGAVALSQAILTFDWVSALTYLFTIIMGVIFGVLQMKATEEWWTEDYLRYAKYVQKKTNEQKVAEEQVRAELTPAAYVENINSLLEEKQNGNKTQ